MKKWRKNEGKMLLRNSMTQTVVRVKREVRMDARVEHMLCLQRFQNGNGVQFSYPD